MKERMAEFATRLVRANTEEDMEAILSEAALYIQQEVGWADVAEAYELLDRMVQESEEQSYNCDCSDPITGLCCPNPECREFRLDCLDYDIEEQRVECQTCGCVWYMAEVKVITELEAIYA